MTKTHPTAIFQIEIHSHKHEDTSMSIEIKFSLIKESDRLVGISLVPERQCEAEKFCWTFLEDVAERGTINIIVRSNHVILTCSDTTSCSFVISEDDSDMLSELLHNQDHDLMVSRYALWGPSFKIMIADTPLNGTAFELQRVDGSR
ncbi:MAG TPA: hypothetical protein ENI66_01210 [Candidatus Yonathbacteria bacterium]|nr:hypothetical protein [Candidatus Yonathbacteria bacterium]